MLEYPSVDHILEVMGLKGYKVFGAGVFDLNIIGIRSKNTIPEYFDDTLVVLRRLDGQWLSDWFTITTDPGQYWLQNPMNVKGTAILKEGQYRGAFMIGWHKLTYKALVQRLPLPVYRDRTLDGNMDFNSPVDTGMFGINIHKASTLKLNRFVWKWSAGCQVFLCPFQFKHFMSLCEEGANKFGNSFTYTLLHERDFQ